jgi:3-carboxy-cis,cis-muconate cycloisomerase
MTGLLDPLMTDPHVATIMSDEGLVRRMLVFEAALARAQARRGTISAEAATAITNAATIAHIDMDDLARATALAGNPAIPLVKMLTARTEAAGQPYVHWGATSQDVMDTALVLQLRDCFKVFAQNLQRLSDALAQMTSDHRTTPMVARTLLQHALPTTFGMKSAGWLLAINRTIGRLGEAAPRVLALQCGGAVGTLASLGADGTVIARDLAIELELVLPAAPWHTQRDRIAETACFCGILTGTLGKIARDISLMAQTDVGEVNEGAQAGRGGSSTMPHKRNPVSCNIVLAIAASIPNLVATILAAQVQDHERGLGSWASEWRTLPEILKLTSGALLHTTTMIENLEINSARMRANLDATNGLVMAEAVMMALAPHVGRLEAHHLVEAASKTAIADGLHLREVLASSAVTKKHLDLQELDTLFDPTSYLGSAQQFIDAALDAHRNLGKAMAFFDSLITHAVDRK